MCIKIELEIGVWIFEEDKKTENSKETFELGLDPNPTHLWIRPQATLVGGKRPRHCTILAPSNVPKGAELQEVILRIFL